MRRREREFAGSKRQRPVHDSPRKSSRSDKAVNYNGHIDSEMLTAAAPLESRRSSTRWDISPKGLEGLLAAQFKVTGLATAGVKPDKTRCGKLVQDIISAPALTSTASWISRVVSRECPGSAPLRDGEWLVENRGVVAAEEPKGATDPVLDNLRISDYIHAKPIETRFMQLLLPLDGSRVFDLQFSIPEECKGVEKVTTSEVIPPLVRPKYPRLFVQFVTAMDCSNALENLGGRLVGRSPLLVATLDVQFAENYVFPK